MKAGLTYIGVLLDRSGSMKDISSDIIGGYNKFIEDQKKEIGEAILTLAQFDDIYEIVYQSVPLKDVQELTHEVYIPRNTTALNDSLAKLINSVGEELNKLPEDEKPEKVVFLIITDGLENASKEYTSSQVKEMVKHQEEKYNWQFVFIGTDIDSFQEGSTRGILNSANFTKSSLGVSAMYASISSNMKSYRSKVGFDATFDKLDIEDTE